MTLKSQAKHIAPVGVKDGWTDLADNYRLGWQYDAVLDGIALTGGFDLSRGTEFSVGLAFGTTEHDALSTRSASLMLCRRSRHHMVRARGATTMTVTASETMAHPTDGGARDGHGHY